MFFELSFPKSDRFVVVLWFLVSFLEKPSCWLHVPEGPQMTPMMIVIIICGGPTIRLKVKECRDIYSRGLYSTEEDPSFINDSASS